MTATQPLGPVVRSGMSKPTFSGSVPRTYHDQLGPLLFYGYAEDVAERLRLGPGDRVLELAAGTGIVTGRILRRMGADARMVVTDLSEAMLEVARREVGSDPRLEFRACDACELAFPDASFDRIACQFGYMFFPDQARAMREARRVLRPGGRYVYNVWGSLEGSPIPDAIERTLADLFPASPPRFLGRMPYAAYEASGLERFAREAGFASVNVDTLELPSEAPTAAQAARAFMAGTPLAGEIAALGVTDAEPLIAKVAGVLAERFGDGPCRSTMRSFVVTAC